MTTPPPKKSLGQNFLVDPNLARKLIDALAPAPHETVLEIGPGTGALTAPLLERTANVLAVEIDRRLVPLLRERFAETVEVIEADILDVDLTALSRARGVALTILGNLPYYASTPILFHLLAHRAALTRAVLTLQSEVVDRCTAGPGSKDYSSLAVQLALYAAPRRLFRLPPTVFRPQPGVISAAVALDFSRPAARQPRSDKALETVVRAAFAQRRKTLRNSLISSLGAPATDALLAAAGIDGKRRAEQLTPDEFVSLADRIA